MNRRTRNTNEQGSLVLDILMGMAIFALISIIAVSGYNQWRERSYRQAVLSDTTRLGNALTALTLDSTNQAAFTGDSFEATATADNDFDITTVTNPLVPTNITLYEGNQVSDWSTNGKDFGFCIEHVADGLPAAWAAYRSDQGGIYDTGRDGGCQDIEPVDGGTGGDPDPDPEPTPDPDPTPTPDPDPEPVVHPVPVNDECAASIVIAQPTVNDAVATSGDVTNLGATEDSSVWFRTWAPTMAYSTYSVEGVDGSALPGSRTLTVYRGPNSYDPNQVGCPGPLTEIGAVTDANPGLSYRTGSGNENYYIKVSSSTANQTNFRLRLYYNADMVQRDSYAYPEGLSVDRNQTQTYSWHNVSTLLWGTTEGGEAGGLGTGSMWYRVVNYWSEGGVAPTYTLSTLAPAAGRKPLGQHTIQVYSGGSSASNPGTLVAEASGDSAASVTFTGPVQGQYFTVRIVSKSGRDAGWYNVRLSRGAV